MAIQTPRISSKILCCTSYFQLSSRCLHIPTKHCLSCLICPVLVPKPCCISADKTFMIFQLHLSAITFTLIQTPGSTPNPVLMACGWLSILTIRPKNPEILVERQMEQYLTITFSFQRSFSVRKGENFLFPFAKF